MSWTKAKKKRAGGARDRERLKKEKRERVRKSVRDELRKRLKVCRVASGLLPALLFIAVGLKIWCQH